MLYTYTHLDDLKFKNAGFDAKWPALSSRSGVFGFHSSGVENASELKLPAHTPPSEITGKSLFQRINAGPSPCIRLKLGVGDRYRVPQFLGYLPQVGWPLSQFPPDRIRKVVGNLLPNRLKNSFVEIPLQHILHMLGTGEPTHQFDVFWSSGDLQPQTYPDSMLSARSLRHVFSDDPKDLEFMTVSKGFMGSKTRTCYSDEAVCSSGFANNVATQVSKPLIEKFQEFRDAGSADAYQFSVIPGPDHCLAAHGDTLVNKKLNSEEFRQYLPYWILWYPHKYRSIKHEYSSSAGQPPDRGDDNPGYIPYNIHSQDAILRKGSNLHTEYFGLPEFSALYSKALCSEGRKGLDLTGFRWARKPDWDYYLLDHAHNNTLTQKAVAHFMAIYAAIAAEGKDLKALRSQFPFKQKNQERFANDNPLGPNCNLSLKDYINFERMVIIRDQLELGMQLEPTTQLCPKCQDSAFLPKRLVDALGSKTLTELKLVCWPCGTKYLVNKVNYAMDSEWLWFDGYQPWEAFV